MSERSEFECREILPINERELGNDGRFDCSISIGGREIVELSSIHDSLEAETDHWNVSFGPLGIGRANGLLERLDFRRLFVFDMIAKCLVKRTLLTYVVLTVVRVFI